MPEIVFPKTKFSPFALPPPIPNSRTNHVRFDDLASQHYENEVSRLGWIRNDGS